MKASSIPITLSIIIPVYNEQDRLDTTITAIKHFLEKHSFRSVEIIFVDDGSTDATLGLLQNSIKNIPARILSYARNRGKGYAVGVGMREAQTDYALMVDADMSTDLTHIYDFLPEMTKGTPVIIGTRKIDAAHILVRQPWWRETLGKGYTFLATLILGISISDFTCGFKCFSKDARKVIWDRACIERWSYDAEILFLAHKYNLAIREVPVTWRNDRRTQVRLYRDVVKSFFDLLSIRVRHRK